MAELLKVVGLTKRYGALVVTDHVDLTVHAGEIHAVIGPNGAGKTSLINQLSGTVLPDAGRVLLAGRDVTRMALHRRARLGLGRGFQITAILPDFSTRENVALAAQARDGSSFRFFRAATAEARLNQVATGWLERVGLADRADVAARALSHGERRQLELAIALAGQPSLLLLDEPLAGAGPEETARLVRLLGGLRGDPAFKDGAMLLVEHDMAAVFALADRISVLAQGRVIATGTPDAIRADPLVRTAYLGEAA